MKLAYMILTLVSCLPTKESKNGDNRVTAESVAEKDNNNEQPISQTIPSKDLNDAFYYHYQFTGGQISNDVVLRIVLADNNGLKLLQTVNLNRKDHINSMPLAELSVAITHGGNSHTQHDYIYSGDSYLGGGGRYKITVAGQRKNNSLTKMYANPPEISFKLHQQNNGNNLELKGTPVKRQSNSDWQRYRSERPQPPNYQKPQMASAENIRWFEEFAKVTRTDDVVARGFKRLIQKRAIVIQDQAVLGAVHEIYDGKRNCYVQIWGFDDVEVLQFLNKLKDDIRFEFANEPIIRCANESENNVALRCRDNVNVDKDLFFIHQGLLVWKNFTDPGIIGYMDRQGRCIEGSPS